MELLCRLIPLRQTYTLWFLLASHVFFAITAILGKRLITAAVYRASSLHPPSKTLLRSLALTDLFVGLLVDSIFIVFLITLDSKCSEICVSFFKISYSTSQILSSVSLSVLTAISVDRLYALILGLRYRQIVTLKRVGLFLVFSWTQGIAFGLAVFINPLIAPYSSLVGIAICLLTSVCSYTKIYKRLRTSAYSNTSTAIEYSPRTINKPGRATKYGEVQKDSIDLFVDIANTCCVLSSPHGGFCVNCF